MSETHDIFLRVHTVVPSDKKKQKRHYDGESPWPDRILAYDCETLTDPTLKLTFGAYRICKLVDDRYFCEEEGLFYADDLPAWQNEVLAQHVKAEEDVYADIEVKSFTPKLKLRLRPRSEFVKNVFFKAILDKTIIVGFNLPFDLARIAEDWGEADDGGHSLILRHSRNPKTGQIEKDTYYPRIVYKALNSKTALIRSTQVRKKPKDDKNKDDADKRKVIFWPHGRFLDVRTLLWALRNKSYSLRKACDNKDGPFKGQNLPQKEDHTPTGNVTPAEIEYCRRDVKCTVAVLNAAKSEYDLHPIAKRPDQLYSPASVAKGYMDELKITHPSKKFKRRNNAFGIAMQAYYGGRAESAFVNVKCQSCWWISCPNTRPSTNCSVIGSF